MNFMTAQLMSKGNIDYRNIARGIQIPLHKADIPDENFTKAGTKVWTDAECKILSQMAEKEKNIVKNGDMKVQWNGRLHARCFTK